MKHLYENSETIYCAESLDQCWELFEKDMDMTRAEEEPLDPFEQIPDERELRIGSDEPSGEPGEERDEKNGLWFVTKAAAEWAAESDPGHFSGGGC